MHTSPSFSSNILLPLMVRWRFYQMESFCSVSMFKLDSHLHPESVLKSKLHMDGFRSLREGEPVEFTFKKSSKGLESLWVTGPGGAPCVGSEKRPKSAQKRRSKGDRCYNCGGPDHHAKECQLPPQPKKCHFCQSMSHMVANCPIKAQQSSPGSQGKPIFMPGEPSHTPDPPESSD
ncbi:hypothetical protein SRHO_G00015200 [Serrasalmus rhombeus]